MKEIAELAQSLFKQLPNSVCEQLAYLNRAEYLALGLALIQLVENDAKDPVRKEVAS